jgi:hypothetical protein
MLPLTLEQIDKALEHTWALVGKARNYEARIAGEKLIRDLRGQITKEDSELLLPPTMRWKILLITTRTVTLVRGGEFRAGGELAVESAQLCRAYGNIRCLERVIGVQKYLERLSREIGSIGADIREAIDGSVGHWEVPTQG